MFVRLCGDHFQMMRSILVSTLRSAQTSRLATRQYAAASASDPIQQLFLDKIREYKQKSS